MAKVSILSTRTLESWDHTTPWSTGIGGSEQSHIEMAERLRARGDFEIVSYVPTEADDLKDRWRSSNDDLEGMWKTSDVVINYRDANAFKRPKKRGQKWYFVAQDVDYGWDEESLSKVDRYLCLCAEHAKYTSAKYGKLLKGKLFISSNGVRSNILTGFAKAYKIERVPGRMLYASSPDRGLQLLLEQWWRIRERVPDATLHVAYGFNNIDTIIKAFGDRGRAVMKSDLEALLNQDGVKWLGRLPQMELYREWAQASVWPYPSDWPETSCITCMDSQALGAIPVTTNFWAQGENVQRGFKSDGLPQKSALARAIWMDNLYKALQVPNDNNDPIRLGQNLRGPMMAWALDKFNWERVVDQWTNWLQEDLKPKKSTYVKSRKPRQLARAAGVGR